MRAAKQARVHPGPLGKALGLAVAAFLALGALLAPVLSGAQEITFFRIGTGSTGGTYFPIGGILASAISKPPGSRECAVGGSCGVPGLIAVAQSTAGSVENVESIAAGLLESGFSQADVAYWAYRGEADFAEKGPLGNLRAIANLFPESLHLVVARDSGIHTVSDLKGKRISLDREGSGTRVDALLVLEAYGLGPEDLDARSDPSGDAADLLRAGELDGFFMVVGYPAKAVDDLARDALIRLVPINGAEAEQLRNDYPFFSPDEIPSGTYFSVPQTETLSVGALWLVAERVPEELVHGITRALWHPNTRKLLDAGHPKGRQITLERARRGLVVPLHPGAERYYDELDRERSGVMPGDPG